MLHRWRGTYVTKAHAWDLDTDSTEYGVVRDSCLLYRALSLSLALTHTYILGCRAEEHGVEYASERERSIEHRQPDFVEHKSIDACDYGERAGLNSETATCRTVAYFLH